LLPEFSSWPLSLQEIVKETTPVLDHNYQPNTLADGFFSIINFCIKEIFCAGSLILQQRSIYTVKREKWGFL
jgi:hypothetical protein